MGYLKQKYLVMLEARNFYKDSINCNSRSKGKKERSNSVDTEHTCEGIPGGTKRCFTQPRVRQHKGSSPAAVPPCNPRHRSKGRHVLPRPIGQHFHSGYGWPQRSRAGKKPALKLSIFVKSTSGNLGMLLVKQVRQI